MDVNRDQLPIAARPLPAQAATRRLPPWSPALVWALLGAAFIIVGVTALARWLGSGTARFSLGDYAGLSGFYRSEVRIVQLVSFVLAMVIVVLLARECRRAGQITFRTAVCIGYFSAFWMDPLGNVGFRGIKYNGAWIHSSSWGPYLPGWSSPGAAHQIEPVLVSWIGFLLGMVWFVGTAWTVRIAVLRYWPKLGGARLALAVLAASVLVDAVFQLICVVTGWYFFPQTISEVTLFSGHQYQLPLLNTVAEGTLWAGVPYLVGRRCEAGNADSTFLLRGLGRLPRAVQPCVRVMAIVGFVNLCLLAFYLLYFLLGKWGTVVPLHGPFTLV
ncbi:spirocyclase AveC family protein [Streptomyces sp. NPDC055299]